jgi:hypothetical protein
VVVADGSGVNHGLEGSKGTGEAGLELLQALQGTGLLLGGLVEPELDTPIPLFVEVYVGYDIVVLHHFGCQACI